MVDGDRISATPEKYFFPPIPQPYDEPLTIVSNEGCYLLDSAGHRYLDCCSGDGVMNAGYRNPMILNAVVDQLWRLQHAAPAYMIEQTSELAGIIAELTPGKAYRSLLCASEEDARRAALQIASLITGSDRWLSSDNASVTDFAALERLLASAGSGAPAAIITEPLPYRAGLLIPPDGYWPEFQELCHRNGSLMIFDESRTAMNRTGQWFACEHWPVAPDLLIAGRSLANGIPIAAVIAKEEVAARCGGLTGPWSAPTPVACAAAMATIRFHRTAALSGRATRHGEMLLAEIAELATRSRHLAHPRGKGLMIAVDVVDERSEPDPGRCTLYLEQLRKWGFLFGKAGHLGNVLTIMPPLTITDEQLHLIASALAEVQHPPAAPSEPDSSVV